MKKNSAIKRLLCALLCALLLVTSLPLGALAEETAAPSSDTTEITAPEATPEPTPTPVPTKENIWTNPDPSATPQPTWVEPEPTTGRPLPTVRPSTAPTGGTATLPPASKPAGSGNIAAPSAEAVVAPSVRTVLDTVVMGAVMRSARAVGNEGDDVEITVTNENKFVRFIYLVVGDSLYEDSQHEDRIGYDTVLDDFVPANYENKHFLGYYTDKTGGQQVFNSQGLFVAMPTVVVDELFAQWDEAVYEMNAVGVGEDENSKFYVTPTSSEEIEIVDEIDITLREVDDTKNYSVTLYVNGNIINSHGLTVDTSKVTNKRYNLEVPSLSQMVTNGWIDSSGYGNVEVIVVEATGTAPTHKDIKFDGDGGNIVGYQPTKILEGGTVVLPTAEKAGYNFRGWSLAEKNDVIIPSGSFSEEDYSECATYTFTASYSPKSYKLTVNDNGAEYAQESDRVKSQTYNIESDDIDFPTSNREIYKTNYTLLGWYTNDKGYGTPIDGVGQGNGILEDITVYAVWEPDSYKLSLVSNGGSYVGVNSDDYTGYHYKQKLQLPTSQQITREGYTFTGWYEFDSLNNTYATSATNVMPEDASGNKTYHAIWEETVFTIKLISARGSVPTYPPSYTVTTDTIQLPVLADVQGYEFGGWYENSDFSGTPVTSIPKGSSGNKTYYARWIAETYLVTVSNGFLADSNGNKLIDETTGLEMTEAYYAANEQVNIVAKNPREGELFKQWEVSEGKIEKFQDYSASFTWFTMPAEKVTLVGEFGYKYNLTRVIDGEKQPVEEHVEGSEIILTAPEITGKRFNGWEAKPQGDVTVEIADPTSTTTTMIMPKASLEIVATYITASPVTYTYTGLKDPVSVGNYISGEEVTVTAENRTGFRFKNWKVLSGGVTLMSNAEQTTWFTMGNTPVELEAVYETLYTVEVFNGTLSDGTTSAYFGANEQVKVNATVPGGQRVDYWIVSPSAALNAGQFDNKNSISFSMPANNLTLNVQFEPLYNLTVKGGEGTGQYGLGDIITIKATPGESQRFEYWTVTSENVELQHPNSMTTSFAMPAETVEIEATYVDVKHVTVTNGTLSDGTKKGGYVPGETVTIIADPTGDARRWKSWSVDSGAAQLVNASEMTTTFTMPDEAVSVTANYDALYTLTVSDGKGSGKYIEGETVTVEADAAEEGETFKEWIVVSGTAPAFANVNAAATTFPMPASNVTLQSTYQPTYPLTILGGSGTGRYYEGETVTITADEIPADQAKRFNNWVVVSGNVTLADPTAATTTFVMPAAPVQINTATVDTYPVTVYDGEGSGMFAESDTVTITSGTPAVGKRFKEWDVISGITRIPDKESATASFTMPANPVEVLAVYEDVWFAEIDGGSGSGEYAAGETVTITAEEIGEDGTKKFKQWVVESGGVELANPGRATTTFTMPKRDVVVVAEYDQSYTLTVDGGFGSGTFTAGETVTITAEDAASGKKFSDWTVTSGNVRLRDPERAETTFTMPDADVTVRADYEDLYTVMVSGGGGSGYYAAGDIVTIRGNQAPEGYRFSYWTVTSGMASISSATTATAKFTMPPGNVEIEAVYVEKGGSSGGGSGGSGSSGGSTSGGTAGSTPSEADKDVPQTSDDGNMTVWGFVLGGSLLGLGIFAAMLFRQKKNESSKSVKRVMAALCAAFVALAAASGVMFGTEMSAYAQSDEAYERLSSTYVSVSLPEASETPADAQGDTAAEETPYVPAVDFEALMADGGEDVVAWMRLNGSPIDYPVSQCGDNDYYLHHMYDGTANNSGCLFVDYENAADFSDRNTIIYGHRMNNGSMFGSLPKYEDQSYFDEHSVMFIETPDAGFDLEVFSAFVASPDEPGQPTSPWKLRWDTGADYYTWLLAMKDRSMVQSEVVLSAEDRIVTLSTCTKDRENRFIVMGRLVERETSPLAEG